MAAVDEIHYAEVLAPCVDVPEAVAEPHTLVMEPPQEPVANQVPSPIKIIGLPHPMLINRKIESQNILPFLHHPRVLLTTSKHIPQTFKSSLKSSVSNELSKAIYCEFCSINKLQVWDIVDLEPNYSLIGTNWVFKTKRDAQGNIIKQKA
ncbi:hypothetical protein O181_106642 [Austropuccinia psidii MF-1]|uniref:Reverse transcriptase Ty1/copia-type domain-containing protein n=1 Tax=Austropuccinia psidii MF-1 TaxID=1389203 RepID=A0A9Q3JSG0_9BASI|nr:hypothetical protein [Austropuccinia psidii MF-1]